MWIAHALWNQGRLFVIGERVGAPAEPSRSSAPSSSVEPATGRRRKNSLSSDIGTGEAESNASTCTTEKPAPQAGIAVAQWLPVDELHQRMGDAWDSLLVCGATDGRLKLRWPSVDGVAVSSQTPGGVGLSEPLPSSAGVVPTISNSQSGFQLQPVDVPALSFQPADAMDILSVACADRRGDVRQGASLIYWSRVAGLVLELLAKQRFVPSIHRESPGRHRGFWRVVVNEESTSQRLSTLVASMPPMCRAVGADGEDRQAAELVENFLWRTVDALVRRCLEGDELVHALRAADESSATAQQHWLRALVDEDSSLHGSAEQQEKTSLQVHEWTRKLTRTTVTEGCRTAFRLIPPGGDENQDAEDEWLLTIHAQSLRDPHLIVDIEDLEADQSSVPRILVRPFENARQQVLEDIAHASQHFPQLAECARENGPREIRLSLADAHTFLRDAAPLLEAEGFGVWLPAWWRVDRPRLQLQMDIRPADGQGGADRNLGLDALVEFEWRLAVNGEDLSEEELNALALTDQPLVQLRGDWLEVSHADLRAALNYLESKRRGTMTVFEALRHCYLTEDAETGLPIGGLRASGWVEKLLASSEMQGQLEHLDPPDEFVGELRPYQLRGVEWLWFHARCGLGACLADDMGLGKTIQMIALWLHERKNGKSPGPTLLIVPMSLVGNWRREIGRFAPTLKVMVHHGLERLGGREFVEQVDRHDVIISTYALCHRDFQHLAAVDWYRIALDEAQNIKNPAAKQSAAIRRLGSVQRLALTGTPVENRLTELWSIMEFLNPSLLGPARDFRRRFAVPIERHHDNEKSRRLRHLIRPFVLRRRKEDPDILSDLPDKMEMKVYCHLTAEQATLYQSLVGDMLSRIEQTGGMQRRGLILSTLVKLKQVCNHPAHFLGDKSRMPERSGKCDRLVEMLDEVVAEGHRALVFTQFRAMGTLLVQHLRETLGIEVPFLHGGTTQKDRDAMVERFQTQDGNVPIFLLSLKAGGFGLNLTAANHVFHFDRWWNPAVEDQATDRVHRIGQRKDVLVHKFVCIGTLEERIDAMIEEKRSLAENIVGGGEAWLTELSTEDLREVFALSREAIAGE